MNEQCGWITKRSTLLARRCAETGVYEQWTHPEQDKAGFSVRRVLCHAHLLDLRRLGRVVANNQGGFVALWLVVVAGIAVAGLLMKAGRSSSDATYQSRKPAVLDSERMTQACIPQGGEGEPDSVALANPVNMK